MSMDGWGRVSGAVIARRAQLGLTQKELAAKAGVAERTVQNLEGGTQPQPLIRGKIEKALGWPAGEMMRMAAEPDPAPKPAIPPDVLAVIKENYDADQQREIIAMLEELSAPRAGAPSGASGEPRRAG